MAETKTLQKLCVDGMKLEFQKCWEQLGISRLYMMALLSRDEYAPILDARPDDSTLYYTDPASGNQALFHRGQFVLWPEDLSETGRGFGMVVDVTNDKDGNPDFVLWLYLEELLRESSEAVDNMNSCRVVFYVDDNTFQAWDLKTARRFLKRQDRSVTPIALAINIPNSVPLMLPLMYDMPIKRPRFVNHGDPSFGESTETIFTDEYDKARKKCLTAASDGFTTDNPAEAVGLCLRFSEIFNDTFHMGYEAHGWWLPSVAQLRALLPYKHIINSVMHACFDQSLDLIHVGETEYYWTIDEIRLKPLLYNFATDRIFSLGELTDQPADKYEAYVLPMNYYCPFGLKAFPD